MDLATVYWSICIALWVATGVMAAALSAFVTTSYESIHRIISGCRKARD
jgi:hypothetical protein